MTEELPRPQKTLLYVMGTIDELVTGGMLQAGVLKLSGGGQEIYRELLAEGFEPTQEEFETAWVAIAAEEDPDPASRDAWLATVTTKP